MRLASGIRLTLYRSLSRAFPHWSTGLQYRPPDGLFRLPIFSVLPSFSHQAYLLVSTRMEVSNSPAKKLATKPSTNRSPRAIPSSNVAMLSHLLVKLRVLSNSLERFAEAFTHVKGYSCCRFVVGVPHIGACRHALLSVVLSVLIAAPQVFGQSKGHKRRASRQATPSGSRANKA